MMERGEVDPESASKPARSQLREERKLPALVIVRLCQDQISFIHPLMPASSPRSTSVSALVAPASRLLRLLPALNPLSYLHSPFKVPTCPTTHRACTRSDRSPLPDLPWRQLAYNGDGALLANLRH
ncbi:hypothetical protein NDU88_007398 [Pleurodeles waltl]|uniref:Uncharacterized protein n=1 Tax=Pleurodeles waltl TaxID=8319 RepID=A0AAV7SS65_PLEWA|nr:hypothetical protein NDU88_007398 [Pleurodeles waltl]